jgi:hypothetical protein
MVIYNTNILRMNGLMLFVKRFRRLILKYIKNATRNRKGVENIPSFCMNSSDLPYAATSISIIGRMIFMYLLYKNRSTNSLSLLFCGLNICSSSMWIYYSVNLHDLPMIFRSSTEISLLSFSALYIIRNKMMQQHQEMQILPK